MKSFLLILLIEDDPEDIEIIREVLRSQEGTVFELKIFNSLASAVECLKTTKVDAILTDLNLPGSKGINTFCELQNLSPNTPIVILSHLHDKELALEAMHKGAQDFLLKNIKDLEILPRILLYSIGRKKYQENLRQHINYLEYYDLLTGLPGRVLFIDRLNQAIAQARGSNHSVSVLSLDLDNFKRVNDTLGHAAGDELLKMVTRRLTKNIPETDSVTRIGGDGFTILLSAITHTRDAMEMANKIVESFTEPFYIHNREIVMGISMGISVYPDDGEDAESLVRNADTAMHRAKDDSRNTYQLYSSSMNSKALERLGLENSLRHALREGQLVVYYQPQTDLKTGKIVSAEALVRWNHPELGLIPPMEFIPVAEEIGLVAPINEWVFETATTQLKAWSKEGFEHLCISLNISSPQLEEELLIKQLKNQLAKTGEDVKRIQLELSEHVLMKQPNMISKTLREFKMMGAKIAIDDFGTGYSSLSHLKRFPVDIIKIDRMFVRQITWKPDDAAIVTAIIAMAHSLNLEVIAEGVETYEQLEILKNYHCDKIQGYLISKPVPANEFIKLLKK